MKYKVGNKVRIKTWEEMEKEFGLYSNGEIKSYTAFLPSMEKDLINLNTDRIVTIKSTSQDINDDMGIWDAETGSHFDMWGFSVDIIECLFEEYVKAEPIHSRFEILDL